MRQLFIIFISLVVSMSFSSCKKNEVKPDWAKKDITDFTDADMERLLDQWEEDEEPLEPDELPEHLRPRPQIDINKITKAGGKLNPEELLRMTKKGQTLMTFVEVDKSLSKDEAERLTKIWQSSLWNNHIQAERYMIEDNRAIFMFKDGSQAWDAKNYLIDQEHCDQVVVDNKPYPGKHISKKSESQIPRPQDEL